MSREAARTTAKSKMELSARNLRNFPGIYNSFKFRLNKLLVYLTDIFQDIVVFSFKPFLELHQYPN